MTIRLDIPVGESQQAFLDYLNSALRTKMSTYTGSAGRLADGKYASTITGPFNIGSSAIPITLSLVRSKDDATIESIEIQGESGSPPESQWQVSIFEFINSVLIVSRIM